MTHPFKDFNQYDLLPVCRYPIMSSIFSFPTLSLPPPSRRLISTEKNEYSADDEWDWFEIFWKKG